MKNYYIIAFALLISAISVGQNGINYKALIKDSSGDAIISQAVTVQFQILEGGITNVFQETHSTTTDANGFLILTIGSGTLNSGSYSAITWSINDHYLNVQVDSGAGLTDLGTTQFMAVPYALNAANVTGLEELNEGNGNGWRLLGKSASRYGDIGNDAVDLSHSSMTSATLGATGAYSFTAGRDNTASAGNSVAIGVGNVASDYAAVAIGNENVASDFGAVAMGNSTNATGDNAVALGRETTASGGSSIALGSTTTATNIGAISMGSATLASGRSAMATGRFTRAQAYSGVALGQYNIGNGNPNAWEPLDPVFEIGIGLDDANRSNALTVLKNGKVGLATPTPNGFLHILANSTSTIPHLELTETSASDGARIVFNNPVETTNRWTLYGRTRDITANSRFNIFHQSTGNIITATGDGMVGIGKSNPNEKLDVNGRIKSDDIQLTTGANAGYVLTSDANGVGSWTNPSSTNWTVAGNNMYSALSGNVGIGTTSPDEKLEVIGNIKANRIELTTGAAIGHVLTSNVDGIGIWASPDDNDWTLSANNMYTTISGNVGVGTTNPQAKLDVLGKIRALELQIPIGAADGYVLTSDASGNATWEIASPNSGDDGDWTINGNNLFHAGNVGILTSNPLSLLSVGGNGNPIASISGQTSIASGYGIYGQYQGSGYGVGVYGTGGFGGNSDSVGIYGRHSSGGIGVRGNAAGAGGIGVLGQGTGQAIAGRFEGAVEVTGKLSLGTSPTIQAYQLAVDGNAAKSLGGSSWAVVSDLRLKDVLGSYKKGLHEIEQLNTIQFKYKVDNIFNLQSKTTEYGFAAQEVQKVFPEAVNEDKDGYLDFNMHVINVAMVNAIQELNEEVRILAAENYKIKDQLSKYEKIEARLMALESGTNNFGNTNDINISTEKE